MSAWETSLEALDSTMRRKFDDDEDFEDDGFAFDDDEDEDEDLEDDEELEDEDELLTPPTPPPPLELELELELEEDDDPLLPLTWSPTAPLTSATVAAPGARRAVASRASSALSTASWALLTAAAAAASDMVELELEPEPEPPTLEPLRAEPLPWLSWFSVPSRAVDGLRVFRVQKESKAEKPIVEWELAVETHGGVRRILRSERPDELYTIVRTVEGHLGLVTPDSEDPE